MINFKDELDTKEDCICPISKSAEFHRLIEQAETLIDSEECNHDDWHTETVESDPTDDVHPGYETEVAVCDLCGKEGMLLDDEDEDGYNETIDWEAYE